MSNLFSIADTEFDDLEDEEFLIEACGFGSNASNNDFCHSNLVKNGLQIPKSDKNVSNKNNHNKLNCLRGNGFSRNSDASINSLAKLRPSPVNSKVVDNGHAENAKRQEYQSERNFLEPLPKRSKSYIKENSFPTQAGEHELHHVLLNGLDRECEFGAVIVDTNKHRKELNEDCTKLNLHNSSNTSSMATLSDGLRYTQNTTALPYLNKTPSRCTTGQSRKIGFETTSCTNIGSPLVSNSRNQTDSSQNICRNIASPLLKKHQNSNGGNHSRESPTTIGRNSLIIDTKCSTPKTRRFPGPAGILPRLEPGQNLENIPSPLTETPKKKSPELCHMINHDNDEDFSTEPWTVMHDEIRKRFPSSVDSLASIIKKAATQQLDKGKVAFVGVLVKSFRSTGLDVSVVLKDPSGEMRGTLHRKVLEEHQDELGPGCGLLLKQVSVFSPSPRKHYLNITPGNIVEVFPVCSDLLDSSKKISEATPKRKPSETFRRPEPCSKEQDVQGAQLCEDNFDDLLEGLDADDDILVEAMNF